MMLITTREQRRITLYEVFKRGAIVFSKQLLLLYRLYKGTIYKGAIVCTEHKTTHKKHRFFLRYVLMSLWKLPLCLGEANLSTKWRRSKKYLKWLDLKGSEKTSARGQPRFLRVENMRTIRGIYPQRRQLSKSYEKRKWKPPRQRFKRIPKSRTTQTTLELRHNIRTKLLRQKRIHLTQKPQTQRKHHKHSKTRRNIHQTLNRKRRRKRRQTTHRPNKPRLHQTPRHRPNHKSPNRKHTLLLKNRSRKNKKSRRTNLNRDQRTRRVTIKPWPEDS